MVAIGSTGDVRPYVLLGRELKKRGHEVTIVCFDMTEKMVTEAGLKFAPLAGSVKDIFMAVMTPGTTGFTFLPKFKNALLGDLPQPGKYKTASECVASGLRIIGTLVVSVRPRAERSV